MLKMVAFSWRRMLLIFQHLDPEYRHSARYPQWPRRWQHFGELLWNMCWKSPWPMENIFTCPSRDQSGFELSGPHLEGLSWVYNSLGSYCVRK
ncbi:hypothetical protein DPMN_132683 [Dreissena polymorpha]|uniref:Uncharacterized protein n=1 Tax=Dreissena polymorpha TaxID=45954 RepID=A0A9D4FSX6_DREPO|nr:hypothetical protein DPMN_132683 [Dreissena polymorpha]